MGLPYLEFGVKINFQQERVCEVILFPVPESILIFLCSVFCESFVGQID